MNYIRKIISIFYYLLNVSGFKYLSFKASILFSVRVEGKKYIKIGRGSIVQRQSWLLALKIDDYNPEIAIGENCAIGDFAHITSVRKVTIEDNVLIANKVYISDNVHTYSDITRPIINQEVEFKGEVILKSGAWIGENVCIIGASVGKNSVIGANSVVTKDIPDYSIAVGMPAKVIKKYDFEKKEWIKLT